MQGVEILQTEAGSAAPERADIAQAIVAHIFDVELKHMRTRTRSPRAALARQITMYLCHIVFGMSVSHLGRTFGRDRSTALYALRHVEDLRDDPELDSTLLYLESLVRSAVGESA